jgi:hypothetical protein
MRISVRIMIVNAQKSWRVKKRLLGEFTAVYARHPKLIFIIYLHLENTKSQVFYCPFLWLRYISNLNTKNTTHSNMLIR